MTILQVLEKMTAGAAGLVELLKVTGSAAPDWKGQADKWIVDLTSAISSENLVALAAALPAEIANIAKGVINPLDHPSDDV